MAIIEEYGAIAKRLRELKMSTSTRDNEAAELEQWHELARQAAREYVENRGRRSAGRLILPQSTD